MSPAMRSCKVQNFQQASKSELWGELSEPRDVATCFAMKRCIAICIASGTVRHVQLMRGKAKKVGIYPAGLLDNILRGLKREMNRKNSLGALEFGPVNSGPFFDEKALEGEDSSVFIDEVLGELRAAISARYSCVTAAHQNYSEWSAHFC